MPKAPVIEQIAVNLEETLKGVQLDAGYCINLMPYRPRRKGKDNPAHGLCAVYQAETSPETMTTGSPVGTIFRRTAFVLNIVITQSAKVDDESIDTTLNLVSADIEKALMLDPQRGQTAHDTELGTPIFYDEVNGAFAVIEIPFVVKYGFLLSDPTTPI